MKTKNLLTYTLLTLGSFGIFGGCENKQEKFIPEKTVQEENTNIKVKTKVDPIRQYNENGQIVREVYDYPYRMEIVDFIYNSQGKKIETNTQYTYYWNGKIDNRHLWKERYNAEGKVAERRYQRYGPGGTHEFGEVWTYKYDQQGRLINDEQRVGNYLAVTNYKYDEQGREIEEKQITDYGITDKKPPIMTRVLCKYNKQGQIIERAAQIDYDITDEIIAPMVVISVGELDMEAYWTAKGNPGIPGGF